MNWPLARLLVSSDHALLVISLHIISGEGHDAQNGALTPLLTRAGRAGLVLACAGRSG